MMKKQHQAFREAIERANKTIDEAVTAARGAGVSERFIADVLRKNLRHRAGAIPKPAMSREDFLKRHGERTTDYATIKQRQREREQWYREAERAYATTIEQQQAEHQKREVERRAEFELTLEIINAGYKVLAAKHHPDKGGSHDAMARLNKGRARLKACA
jgi:transposase-like protein